MNPCSRSSTRSRDNLMLPSEVSQAMIRECPCESRHPLSHQTSLQFQTPAQQQLLLLLSPLLLLPPPPLQIHPRTISNSCQMLESCSSRNSFAPHSTETPHASGSRSTTQKSRVQKLRPICDFGLGICHWDGISGGMPQTDSWECPNWYTMNTMSAIGMCSNWIIQRETLIPLLGMTTTLISISQKLDTCATSLKSTSWNQSSME
mmetsp:Transcript_2624/g.10033  ORF Transcript_2624/g.10033 Transcript_2624/m.10033 type:complete len:205 (+) Transcript_2624:2923-3537(+)